MPRIIVVIFVLIFIFGFQLSCNQENRTDDRINVMSPDVNGSLVLFYKKETTWDEISEFQRTVIATPSTNGTGFSSLPGVMTDVFIIINDFKGESINFQPSAAEEEKALIKKRISESPLIYKVFENVVPSEIKDL